MMCVRARLPKNLVRLRFDQINLYIYTWPSSDGTGLHISLYSYEWCCSRVTFTDNRLFNCRSWWRGWSSRARVRDRLRASCAHFSRILCVCRVGDAAAAMRNTERARALCSIQLSVKHIKHPTAHMDAHTTQRTQHALFGVAISSLRPREWWSDAVRCASPHEIPVVQCAARRAREIRVRQAHVFLYFPTAFIQNAHET